MLCFSVRRFVPPPTKKDDGIHWLPRWSCVGHVVDGCVGGVDDGMSWFASQKERVLPFDFMRGSPSPTTTFCSRKRRSVSSFGFLLPMCFVWLGRNHCWALNEPKPLSTKKRDAALRLFVGLQRSTSNHPFDWLFWRLCP